MQEIEDQKASAVSELLQGELTPTEALEHRLERYAKAKSRTEPVREYIINLLNVYPQEGNPAFNRTEFEQLRKLRDQLKECGSFLMIRRYYTKAIDKLVGGCTCKRHLLCMLCALRRSARQMRKYKEKINQVMSDNPGQKLILVTLTVKNGDDLRERYRHLTRSLKVLTERRRHYLLGSRKEFTVFGRVSGAVWTMEVTNKGNGWHPHCHMLALVDQQLNVEEFQAALTKEWSEISGDSFIVDARPVQVDQENWNGALCEVFKYVLKTSDMIVENRYSAYRCLTGKRLIASIGSLYGVQVSEDLHDDIEEELKDQPYQEILYRYSQLFGYQEWESIDHTPELLQLQTKTVKPAYRRKMHFERESTNVCASS